VSNKSTASNSIGASYSHKAAHFINNSEEKKIKTFSRKTPGRKKPDITIRNLVKNVVNPTTAEEKSKNGTEYISKPKEHIIYNKREKNITLNREKQQKTKILAKLRSRDNENKVFLNISKRKLGHRREINKLLQKNRNKEIEGSETNPKEKTELSKGSESSYEEDCRTVIEHDCDNDYSLICNTLNEVLPFC